jgi:hypothetical protein
MEDRLYKSSALYNRLKCDTAFQGKTGQDGEMLLWAFRDHSSESTVVLYTHYDGTALESHMDASIDIHYNILKSSLDLKRNILMIVDFSHQVSRNEIFLLIDKMDLKVDFIISSEPQHISQTQDYTYYEGAPGRIKPFVLVRGSTYMPEDPFAGLGSIGLMNEIIKAVELNVEMCDSVDKLMVAPPRFIAQKFEESNGIPEYGVAVFNWLYLHDALEKRFDQLKTLCTWSAEDAINQYNYSYNEFLRKQGLPSYECCHQFEVPIITLSELSKDRHLAFDTPDQVLESAKILCPQSSEGQSLVVIGLLPDYVPEYSSKGTDLSEKVFQLIASEGIKVNRKKTMLEPVSANALGQPSESWTFARSQMTSKESPLEKKGYPVIYLGPGYLEDETTVSTDHIATLIPKLIKKVINEL